MAEEKERKAILEIAPSTKRELIYKVVVKQKLKNFHVPAYPNTQGNRWYIKLEGEISKIKAIANELDNYGVLMKQPTWM